MPDKNIPLTKLVTSLQNGTLKPAIYVGECLARIESHNKDVQAILPEFNIKNRIQAEIKHEKSPTTKPLQNVLLGVKDLFNVKGFPTQGGSNLPPETFAGKEATCVTRLKNAGCIVVGKTVTTEFAYFEPGLTRNPHNLNCTPGGSSSGSAAAVAAGFCSLALGTQTIGSISRPAAFCGVTGFKPSYGRIPTDGVIPFSQAVDTMGFMLHEPDGINLVASIICDNWKSNTISFNNKPVIGIPVGNYLAQANSEVLAIFKQEVQKLINAGFTVKEIPLFENIEEINNTHKRMIAAEFTANHTNWFERYEKLYRPRSKELFLEGKLVPKEEVTLALQGRQTLREKIENIMAENSILAWICPSTITDALEGISATGSPLMNLPWTYAGMPTISIPAGISARNLPLGMQFIGKYMGDEELVEVCKYTNTFLKQH